MEVLHLHSANKHLTAHFQFMMMTTETTQVALLCLTIPISDHMIQITDRNAAAGESALSISGFDKLGQCGRRSVLVLADSLEVSHLIGENLAPRSLGGKLPR